MPEAQAAIAAAHKAVLEGKVSVVGLFLQS
jgi:hypothetical protein